VKCKLAFQALKLCRSDTTRRRFKLTRNASLQTMAKPKIKTFGHLKNTYNVA